MKGTRALLLVLTMTDNGVVVVSSEISMMEESRQDTSEAFLFSLGLVPGLTRVASQL